MPKAIKPLAVKKSSIPVILVSATVIAAWYEMPIATVRDIFSREGVEGTRKGFDFAVASRALHRYWRIQKSETTDRAAAARARQQEAEAEASEIKTAKEKGLLMLAADAES